MCSHRSSETLNLQIKLRFNRESPLEAVFAFHQQSPSRTLKDRIRWSTKLGVSINPGHFQKIGYHQLPIILVHIADFHGYSIRTHQRDSEGQ